MDNLPPPAEELRLIDRELFHLEARRSQLLTRRAWLMDVLQGGAFAAGPPAGAGLAGPVRDTGETSRPSVQNVLLTLGGVLLAVAAVAFTVVSWGYLSIGGRGAVLGVLTMTAMGIPAVLLRRGLRSTAEAVACLGLVLLWLDGYALHRVALPRTGAAAYWAVASTAICVLWAGYGLMLRSRASGYARTVHRSGEAVDDESVAERPGAACQAVPGLRLPLPIAVAIGQLPLPLWAVAISAGLGGFAGAFLATAAVNTVVAVAYRGARASAGAGGKAGAGTGTPVEAVPGPTAGAVPETTARVVPGVDVVTAVVAALGAVVTGASGLSIALWMSVTAETLGAATEAAGLLAVGAALAGIAAWWAPRTAAVTGAVSGLVMIAAIGGVVAVGLPPHWVPVGYLLCAVALLSTVRAPGIRPRRPLRYGLALSSAVVQAGAVVWAVPAVMTVLWGAVRWAGRVWVGVPEGSRALVGSYAVWPGTLPAPATLLIVAAVLAIAYWTVSPGGGAESGAVAGPDWGAGVGRAVDPGRLRTGLAATAVGLASAGVIVLPVPLDLGYVAVLVWLVAMAAVLGIAAARIPAATVAVTALGCAMVASLAAAGYALAERPATFAVLGALLALSVLAATWSPGRVRPGATAVMAVLCATGLAVAAPAAWGLPVHQTAYCVLLVPASTALLTARIREHPAAVPAEVTGWLAAGLAVALASTYGPALATVLALAGVVATGTALRADRRPAAKLAVVLFVLAAWVRLAASGVDIPEAYTLPVTVPALVIGWLRRRRHPATGSWTAYGPGLAATLLPSLVATWNDLHWSRPLLLGLAALAVTLLGANRRLQAPLVLGAGVLALDAFHELAPYVIQVVDALPRWLPPALAGLLLLAVGATYEKRLREARRLRDALGRMR